MLEPYSWDIARIKIILNLISQSLYGNLLNPDVILTCRLVSGIMGFPIDNLR